MNLLSSTSVFTFYTLISRLLGYLRDILIAIFLGASIYADAFFVAFRFPNTFRRLFAEGTFNAAFIPSFANEKIKGKIKGKKFADEVLSLLILILLFIIFIIEIFTPFFVYLIAPGFYENSEKFNLAVEFTRITLPFLFFVSLSSFFSGILNSYNKFAASAAAPIILNIILILSLILSHFFKLNFAKNLSYAVTLSGIIQLIFLIYFTKRFYSPSLEFRSKISNKVKFFLKKLLPSVFSSGVTQINILVGTIIASFQAGAVSYLYYADRVYQINLAIAGIAVGAVSLPILSNYVKKKQYEKIKKIQNQSIELSLLLSIPACFGLLIASEEIISALFGYGSFKEEDVVLTSQALKYFGYGIPAFALIKILSNFFFANDNTKIPFYLSVFNVFINITISIYFFKEVGFIIIPIATSVSTWIAAILYIFILAKNRIFLIDISLVKNFLMILISSIIMSLILYFLIGLLEDKFVYGNNYKSIYLLIMIGLVAIIYLIICKIFGLLNFKKYKTN